MSLSSEGLLLQGAQHVTRNFDAGKHDMVRDGSRIVGRRLVRSGVFRMSRVLDGSSTLRGEVILNVLYIREGPGASYKRNGQLTRSARVTIYAEEEIDFVKWYCISIGHCIPEGWVRTFRIEEGYEDEA